jgi:cbb3-type cytochrome c oxidase subunit III
MSEVQDAEVIQGHEYDGIQELDNDLPRWWLNGFYFTMVFAVVYLLYYHFSGIGPSPEQEFLSEMADAGYRIPRSAIKDVIGQDMLLGIIGVLCAAAAMLIGEILRIDRESD